MKRELYITLIKNPSLVPQNVVKGTTFTEERECRFRGIYLKLIPQHTCNHLCAGGSVAGIGYMAISVISGGSRFILLGKEVIYYENP